MRLYCTILGPTGPDWAIFNHISHIGAHEVMTDHTTSYFKSNNTREEASKSNSTGKDAVKSNGTHGLITSDGP